jgi:hypothetical protein
MTFNAYAEYCLYIVSFMLSAIMLNVAAPFRNMACFICSLYLSFCTFFNIL